MRKSFLVFFLGVVGGTIWLLLQNFDIRGLEKIEVLPRQADAEKPAEVPVSLPARKDREVIRIASFNIQNFGQKKLSQPQVMEILAKIVERFDIVAIQEIESREDNVLPRFVDLINSQGRHFDFVIGPRLGRTNNTEQYGFLFDQETIEVNRSQLYTVNDPDDVLHREPLVAWFRARAVPPEQAFTFSLINIHTDPDEVDREINVLDDVLRAVRDDGRREDDAILLGDLNADERHFDQLGRVTHIFAAIPAGVSTKTLGTRGLDNIVFDRLATTEFTGRAGVFNFVHEEFNLSKSEALAVSDHLPVWAEFTAYEGGLPGRVATTPDSPTTTSR